MNKIREDFPFFNQKNCVTFLDSAASSQKPKCVIDKIVERNATLPIIPISEDGELRFDEFEKLISSKVKLIAITHMSNVFGSIVDVKRVVKVAKKYGVKVLVDACQSIAHMKIDVTDLDCDFLVFSSHKLYGPTGVGILYGKYKMLDSISGYQTGGSMIDDVSFEKSTFLKPPYKFEAGTPAIAESFSPFARSASTSFA